jgi:hypothetical protein
MKLIMSQKSFFGDFFEESQGASEESSMKFSCPETPFLLTLRASNGESIFTSEDGEENALSGFQLSGIASDGASEVGFVDFDSGSGISSNCSDVDTL